MQKSLKDEIKYLEKIISENPNSILFARLGDCYMQMGRLDEAIEICERGVRIHPNYISGHFVLGKCYFRKKLFDLAEKELKRVIILDPKYIAAYRELGELMAQNGWQSACESNFEEILRIDPLNERAKQRLAMIRQQFALNEQMQTKTEDISFQPEQGDDTILRESTLSHEEETLFDLEEKEPEKPLTAEPEQPPAPALDESSEKELDLLEDIFKDDSISDLDAESSLGFGEEQAPSPFEEPVEESPGDTFETPPKIAEPVFAEPEHKTEDIPPQDIPDISESEEQFQEYDPFYQLQKEREKEKDEVEESLFPFEAEEGQTQPPPQPAEQPAFEPDHQQPIPSQEEKPPIQEKPRSSSTKESLATPTLGEIYAAQRQYAKAIGVYELLLKKDPDNETYKQKIEQLRQRMEEEAG